MLPARFIDCHSCRLGRTNAAVVQLMILGVHRFSAIRASLLCDICEFCTFSSFCRVTMCRLPRQGDMKRCYLTPHIPSPQYLSTTSLPPQRLALTITDGIKWSRWPHIASGPQYDTYGSRLFGHADGNCFTISIRPSSSTRYALLTIFLDYVVARLRQATRFPHSSASPTPPTERKV